MEGPWLLGRGQPEMVEDALDGERVGDEGDELHLLAAAGAGEGVDRVNLCDQACPGG
jgi:hypothetical protein